MTPVSKTTVGGGPSGPPVDRYGRVHTSLRVSVTDRCNIRCFYCMPDTSIRFKRREELLTFEEIERVVGVAAGLGVDKVRLTGGEPLVRANLDRLVRMLAQVPGLTDLALTTNGILLAEQAASLRQAGLQRLNISLDGLTEATFRRISRRDGLNQVLEGIATAQRLGFRKIRLNAVAIRGITEPEIVPLASFARNHGLEVRFIEFMPLDADQAWRTDQVLNAETILRTLEEEFGPLVPVARDDVSQPATNFSFADGEGQVGVIRPITAPFCSNCNRLRITAEGQLRNCLFSTVEWDVRELLRGGGSDAEIAQLIRDCVATKKAGHGIDDPDFVRPVRPMYQIGG
ncbi:MAG: GTP 3',8-cyclase MoaA [Pirellulales bacterium]